MTLSLWQLKHTALFCRPVLKNIYLFLIHATEIILDAVFRLRYRKIMSFQYFFKVGFIYLILFSPSYH